MNVSTIAAISTPVGQGGIGVIRLSGPQAIDIALSVFMPKNPKGMGLHPTHDRDDHFFPESRRIYHGHIVDPASRRILDEILFFVMRAPCSYTTEDMAEIQTHASPVVMQSVLNLLLNAGARIAEPGEFTRRAFLNGRIDLTEAEAVADIICARSESALDTAMAHMSGQMKTMINGLKDRLFDILVSMEAAIDFPDDVGEIDGPADIADRLDPGILSELDRLVDAYADANFLRDGLKLAIIGGPNVGKSSLFNRLLNRDRAIVSETPGTTRDFIEDSLVMQGIPVILTDTAGIRENPGPLEGVGIEKAWQTIASSDMVLFVVDAGVPATTADLGRFAQINEKKVILVINKMDLAEADIRFTIPRQWANVPCSRISALRNQGIDTLKHLIASIAFAPLSDRRDYIIPNLRQKKLLEKAMIAVSTAAQGLRSNHLFELASIDLKNAIDALAEVAGENIRPDVLDDIFSRFCIGK
jgi:tRNA modification GTPase